MHICNHSLQSCQTAFTFLKLFSDLLIKFAFRIDLDKKKEKTGNSEDDLL